MNHDLNLTDLSAPAAERPSADVQRLWRSHGWRAPSEYRRDFAHACKPAILAGMVRLTPGRALT